jgi:hypothetical protein
MQALRRWRKPVALVLQEQQLRERPGLLPVQVQLGQVVLQVSAQRQSWGSQQVWRQSRRLQ